jgi:hypothetical protein
VRNGDDDDRSFRFPTKIFARSIAVCLRPQRARGWRSRPLTLRPFTAIDEERYSTYLRVGLPVAP